MSEPGGDSGEKSDQREQTAASASEELQPGLIIPSVVPPPPAGTSMPGTTLNIALMQKPDAVAQLPLEIQRQIFSGIEKDNERQFEIVKKQMDLADKARSESMQERTTARAAAADERWKIRKIFLIGGCVIVGVIGGIFVFMIGTGHEAGAMALLENVVKVGSGAIGGAGSATVYQRAKKPNG